MQRVTELPEPTGLTGDGNRFGFVSTCVISLGDVGSTTTFGPRDAGLDMRLRSRTAFILGRPPLTMSCAAEGTGTREACR